MPSMNSEELDDEALDDLMPISEAGDPGPWRSMAEGRDHDSGDAFIMVGTEGDRREDLYLSRDSGRADTATLDLVAGARTALPLLVREIRRLRSLLADN